MCVETIDQKCDIRNTFSKVVCAVSDNHLWCASHSWSDSESLFRLTENFLFGWKPIWWWKFYVKKLPNSSPLLWLRQVLQINSSSFHQFFKILKPFFSVLCPHQPKNSSSPMINHEPDILTKSFRQFLIAHQTFFLVFYCRLSVELCVLSVSPSSTIIAWDLLHKF